MQHIALAETLSSNGVRPTQQRVAVYDYLLRNDKHPSADIIYQSLSKKYPVFSRTTIYNSLKALVSAGLVRVVPISSEEQHFDACVNDHGHFLCHNCNNIFDFEVDKVYLSSVCPKGYTCDQGDLLLKGICPNCVE